ncbi:uncharacterized protein LOC129877234 isoform X2 [Solanum dulcamara]|uniref:uncharacterized protein LOC129877234 isoform X2 n=1 Tax=Solanum dulcamara TaxID=45834 RepID=UPI00248580A6|nr:uncharacterized protein LOC129877234 isoform X2 [Solanum dulcamara]
MEAGQQQQQYHSWKLNVQAKAKNLNFKLANISQSTVVLGNLAHFIQSIYQGDKDGIFILGSIVIICFVSLFKKIMARKAWTLLIIVIGTLVLFSNAMHLRFRSQFDHQHYLSGFFWRAFKNAASSACLYILSQLLTAISRLI